MGSNKYTVAAEFLSQKIDNTYGEQENQQWTSKDICRQLSSLESAALSSILEIAALQLFIIDVGTCSESPTQSNVIVRKKIREVLEKTREEIRANGTFNYLCHKAKEENESRKQNENLKKEMFLNHRRIEELKLKLKGHEFAKTNDINKKHEIIASLKDKIHDEITKSNIKLRYIDRWEAARQSQNRLRCQDIILDLELKIEELTNKSANEIRIHHEMCTFLILEEQRLNEELNEWKEKHSKELEKREERMKLLRTKRKEQQILLRDLRQLYEERRKEIDDYLDFKEKIRKEEERKMLVNNMAVRLQAWWRGTMVRRGIGAFKRKKKPQKEKKKN